MPPRGRKAKRRAAPYKPKGKIPEVDPNETSADREETKKSKLRFELLSVFPGQKTDVVSKSGKVRYMQFKKVKKRILDNLLQLREMFLNYDFKEFTVACETQQQLFELFQDILAYDVFL